MFSIKKMVKKLLDRPKRKQQRALSLVREMVLEMTTVENAKDALAYNILRDLDISHKDELLVSFYPKCGRKISRGNFAMMKRFLELTHPICISNLVRIGGANDGGYVMINPKINLFHSHKLLESTLHNNNNAQYSTQTHTSTYFAPPLFR